MSAAGDKINAFTLIRQLGAGGMGETWEAVRVVGTDFEQRVAIKIADPDSLRSKEGMDLFRREASLAASLRHPNIAAVLDVDEELGCIICELVEGADLRAVLRASPTGTLHPSVVVMILSQLARGLSHAHRRVLHGKLSPVVHRDMSPGNVVLDYDGNLKIVDFGIAKAIASADISETIKGKLSYMAPEQAMGSRVDGRVDQYACGVMAYEAICGVRPNDGTHDGETLANILSGKHIHLSQRGVELPDGLADVIERMLSVAPDHRFTSMDGVTDALEPYAPPITAHRELAELVLKARPVQTVVLQNGVYVSRPVAQETLQRDPTPRGRRKSEAGSGRVGAGNASASGSNPAFRPELLGPGAHTQPAMSNQGPSIAPPIRIPPSAGGSSSQPLSLRPPPALPVRDDDADARSLRPSGGKQALVLGTGALLLAALSWVVFSADSWGTTSKAITAPPPNTAPPSLAPNVPPPSAPAADAPSDSIANLVPPSAATPPASQGESSGPASAVGDATKAADPAGSDSLAPLETKPRRTYREKKEAAEKERAERADRPDRAERTEKDRPERAEKDSAQPAAKTAKNTATARIKVFPWGRVWIDGKLIGSVPPILEVNLSPGPHEIAVGHERPMESRNVSLAPGASALVPFDLEGK